MRIGDTIDAGLLQYRPEQFVQQSGISSQLLSDAMASAADKFGDVLEQRKQNKEAIKINSELLDAAIKLYGDQTGALTGYLDKLKDGEIPESQRAGLAKGIGDLINMDVQRSKDALSANMDAQELDFRRRELGMREQAFNDEMFETGRKREEQDALAAAAGPLLLGNVMELAKGRGISIDPAITSNLSPANQEKMAGILASLLPEEDKPEFRDIPITMDGQPGTATAAFNRQTGTFDIVPVREAGQVQGLPAGLAPYAGDFNWLGEQYGVDPRLLAAISMHETAKGTSNAFRNKNNAMGVSDASGATMQASVPASIERMAKLLGSRTSGPYKDADQIAEIAGIYAPIGAGNDPKGLNKHWVDGVSRYYKQLGGDPSAVVKVSPGAAKGGTKTPTEQKLDEARLAQIQQETTTQKQTQELAKSKDADMKAGAIQSAQDAIRQIDSLEKDPGFHEAVGASFYNSLTPWKEDNTPAGTDKAGAVAKIEQLKGHAFLNAIQQMRGLGQLSDAEGARIQAAAARLDRRQGEKAFKQALKEYRESINAVLQRLGGQAIPVGEAGASAVPTAADYNSRFNNRIKK